MKCPKCKGDQWMCGCGDIGNIVCGNALVTGATMAVPQSPADATATRRKFEELVDSIGDLPTTAMATSGLRPAAPHVAVDGDGDARDEVIAAEMAMEEIDTFGPPEDEDALAGIIAAGIARGREMGARDELTWCEAVAAEEMCGSKRTMSERLTGQRIIEQIQARRAGRGT